MCFTLFLAFTPSQWEYGITHTDPVGLYVLLIKNAQRRERVLSRIDKEFNMGTFGFAHHVCPYSSMGMPHLHHHHGPMPLYHGTHMAPMAHRPWPRFVPGHSNQGHRFGMMTNPRVVAHESTPQIWYQRDVGILGSELNQVPSLARFTTMGTSNRFCPLIFSHAWFWISIIGFTV
ncbi:hypothetical protein RJT34_14715 [Clitoria ternatea]|uniref:Uncharacterized protein n=1 Tax=Clitoria ternatea TaxID=43366 RepID=A0AAN9PN68_CLITE